MKTKRFFLFGLPAALLALSLALAGCPADTVLESGEDYVTAAVLVNEKAKYNTAAVFEFDESDAGRDVTEAFMEIKPGKSANREVSVSISGIEEKGYFDLFEGRLRFTGRLPPEADDDEAIPNGEIITLSFVKDGETATLDVLAVVEKKGAAKDPERVALSDEATYLLYGYDVIKSAYLNRKDVKITRPILDVDKVNAADLGRRAATTDSVWEYSSGESVKEMQAKLYGLENTDFSQSLSSLISTVALSSLANTTSRSLIGDFADTLSTALGIGGIGIGGGGIIGIGGGGGIIGSIGGSLDSLIGKIPEIPDENGENGMAQTREAVLEVVAGNAISVAFAGKTEDTFTPSEDTFTPSDPTVKVTKRYAKGRGVQVTQEEWLRKSTPSVLKNLLDDSFQADIGTKTAAYLLDTYGTHLIVRCNWGGAAEFNYSYSGETLNNDGAMETALNAVAKQVTSAALTQDDTQKVNDLNSNAVFKASSQGGNNTAFTTADQFMAGYAAWVQSVAGKPDLCGIPNVEDSLLAIWDLAAEINPVKAEAIQTEFARRALLRSIALEAYAYTPGVAPTYTYVTNVAFTDAASNSEYPHEVKNEVATNGNTVFYPNDNSLLRLLYRTEEGSNNHNAIAELRVFDTAGSQLPKDDLWHTAGVFDVKNHFYLQYRRVNANDTWAIDFIGSHVPEQYLIASVIDAIPNMELVRTQNGAVTNLTPSYSFPSAKLVIEHYLVVRKTPFKW